MSISTQHLSQPPVAVTQQRKKRGAFHPLLKMQIAPRLGLAFLIPLLMAIVAMGNVAWQDQQLQSREATFYQSLVQGNTLLHNQIDAFDQLRSNLLGMLSDASKPGTSLQTLTEDSNAITLSSSNMDAALNTYRQHDLFDGYADLTALFTQAGHGPLIKQQRGYTGQVISSWQTYLVTQQLILNYINEGNTAQAYFTEQNLAEHDYADSIGSLMQLLQFNRGLIPAVNDAIRIEQSGSLWTTIIAGLCILLGIGIVVWLVFATLVKRLQHLRRVVNSIENGNVEARLDVVGHDEIARVSGSINDMLDTIVGLLEETRQQRDELANAEELKHLHQELQSKHEALNEANARLASLATTDPLTGLPNHRSVMNRLEEEISRCQRTQESCAVLFIDLDHFKQINDTWGHRAGDAVLCETGQRLSKTLRLEDFVGRYGGEEFAVILTDVALDEASQVAERLQHVLAGESFYWEADDPSQSTSISITGSIGVALLRAHANTCETLIEAADAAMYHAKRTGRNRVCISGEEKSFVRDVLEEDTNEHTPDTYVLQALTAVASAHDGDTSAHSMRMVNMAKETARALGCTEEEVRLVRLAALLHDIGKVGVPHEILRKPGPLTDDEWSVMRRHPKIGRQILAQAGGKFEMLSYIVVAHHERWDGKGYPYGLSGEAIPLGARILAVADSFDAMTSDRPYRKALPIADARKELQRCAGNQYDPRVVAAFLHTLDAQAQGQPNETLAVP
ncbi:MAG TPA: diguanylate cyclase [Ktedonobacteraceae bacterium]|nr:diguanylate cyclase [Ktedonobacteraceae bacterium]